jgi:hypothetical protein
MEGGGITKSGLELSDIGDYKKMDDLFVMANASLFTIFLSIIAIRLGNLGGIYLNTYFDVYGLEGVLSNMMLIIILMQLARYIYTGVYGSYGKEWSPFVFICIIMSVQLVHDLVFYFGLLNSLPDGKNDMIDIIKKYAKENSRNALGGHIILLGLTAIIAMIMKNMPDIYILFLSIIILYLLPFILSIVFKKQAPPAQSPPIKKDGMNDYRGY